jgi:hypothetical protein
MLELDALRIVIARWRKMKTANGVNHQNILSEQQLKAAYPTESLTILTLG